MHTIELTYSKKLGLPNYSSHSHSVTIRTELADLSQLEKTNAELYARLQASVDAQIVKAGHLPGETRLPPPANPAPATSALAGDEWACSPKQRALIEKIVAENNLDKAAVENLAQERFKTGVKTLNKLQASSLIDELIETHQRPANRGRAYAGRRS